VPGKTNPMNEKTKDFKPFICVDSWIPMTTRILTGITTTGTPHLGNYAGAIRPAIVASRDPQADSFYFLADYHALIKCDDPARIQRSRLEQGHRK